MSEEKNASKLSLAEAFIDLVKEVPLEKITVKMITEKADKHRKTFYYHFSDKRQLIAWIFRYDLAKGLRNEFPGAILIWRDAEKGGIFSSFPYYVRNLDEQGRIDNARFFDIFAKSLEVRKSYYREVFAAFGGGTLEDYIYNLYWPAFKDDISFTIDYCIKEEYKSGRVMTRDQIARETPIEFLAELFTGAFMLRFIKRLNQSKIIRTIDDIMPYDNVLHDSLYLMFKNAAENNKSH